MFLDRRLLALTAAVRGRLALATLIGLLAVPVSMWRLTITGQILALVLAGAGLAAVGGPLVLVAGLVILRAILLLVRDDIANRASAQMKSWLRRRLYERIAQLGPGYFDQRRTGDTVLTLVEGVEQLDVIFGPYVPQLIVAALTPVIIFAFMATFDAQIAAIYLFFAIVTLIAPAALNGLNRSSSMAFRRSQSAMSSEFLDNIQGLPTLKAFGQSGQRGAQLADRARDLQRRTMRVLAENIASGSVTLLGIGTGAAVALAWGAIRVQEGTLEISTLLVVLLLGTEVFRPLRDLTTLYHSGMLALAAARGVFQLLDAPIEIQEPPRSSASATLRPTIRFEDVTFGYQGGRRTAIVGCSLEVGEGETLGIVGPSGAGKSTLVNLILRFVDPQRGRVLVGEHDVRDLPLETLRSQVALVAQDTYLFYGTVADNLRMGKRDATQDELESAARAANAHDFIMALPRGYDAVVGERGVRLSGGQRQRLAIARAILKDAPILVLDEALSSVDADNEATIQEALDRLRQGRTTLVIAHRLSSVATADRIVVLDRGSLVESGTPGELLRAGGVYARLMAAQQPVEDSRRTDMVVDRELQDAPAPVRVSSLSTDGHSHAHGAGDMHSQHHAHAEPTGSELAMRRVWTRLLRLVHPWLGETVLTLLAGPVYALSNVALGALSAILVGQVATGGNIWPWIWAVLIVAPLTAVLRWLDSWISHDLAYRLLTELRIRLYQLLDPLAPAYLQRRRSGDLVSATISDVELIELFYAHTLSPLFVAIVVPGVVLVALALMSPLLALVLVPFLVLVALTPAIATRESVRLGQRLRELSGGFNAHTVDSLQGLPTIAAFTAGRTRAEEVESQSRELATAKADFLRLNAVQNAVIDALMGFGSVAVISVGAWLVTNGQLARTQLPLATLLAMSAFLPVVSVVLVAKELMQTLAAARRYFTIEDEPIPVRDGPREASFDDRSRGLTVSFDAVSFAYGPRERAALSNVSFSVGAGKTVALVGRSGAGKTTAAHLLLRFWDPQHGSICIGSEDVRAMKLDALRRTVALVAQDTYLFNMSLRENLRLGRPEAPDEEVLEAARRANVDEFASALPEGYDTVVGERGMQLSGGQRQRVAIARALLKDAPILVLDEATSHLDAVNEAEVRAALAELMVGRTTLVIAHRLSTIRSADLIVVLDNGSVVEQGSHPELLALDGLYSHLIATQLAVADLKARGTLPTLRR